MKPWELFGHFIDFGKDVLSATLDATTNIVQAQVGNSTAGAADAGINEWWQHTGFCSMPAPPTPGNVSCQTVRLRSGRRDFIIATRDTRASSIYGGLQPGEFCVYATVGQARVFGKANGAVVVYTTSDNTPTGTSVTVYVGPDRIQATNQFGQVTLDSAGFSVTVGQASLTLGSDGKVTINGQQVGIAGSVVAVSGQVATSIGNAPGSKTLLGAAASPASPVAITSAPGVVSTSVFASPT